MDRKRKGKGREKEGIRKGGKGGIKEKRRRRKWKKGEERRGVFIFRLLGRDLLGREGGEGKGENMGFG